MIDVVREVPRLRGRESARTGHRRGEDGGEIEELRLRVMDHLRAEQLDRADDLVERARTEAGEVHAHGLRDEHEVVDDILGLARKFLAQRRILRGDADRAGVEVALAQHHAASRDQRRGGHAELLAAEERRDDHVA